MWFVGIERVYQRAGPAPSPLRPKESLARSGISDALDSGRETAVCPDSGRARTKTHDGCGTTAEEKLGTGAKFWYGRQADARAARCLAAAPHHRASSLRLPPRCHARPARRPARSVCCRAAAPGAPLAAAPPRRTAAPARSVFRRAAALPRSPGAPLAAAQQRKLAPSGGGGGRKGRERERVREGGREGGRARGEESE